MGIDKTLNTLFTDTQEISELSLFASTEINQGVKNVGYHYWYLRFQFNLKHHTKAYETKCIYICTSIGGQSTLKEK